MHRRTHIIRSARMRRVLRWIALALLLFAASTCLIRLAWTWDTVPATGGSMHNSVRIQHGLFIIERLRSPTAPSATSTVIYAQQFDPGVVIDTFSLSMTTPGLPGGPTTTTTLQFGITTIAGLLAIILFANTLRLRKIPPGTCVCGYDLRNIASPQCPECGEIINQPDVPA